MNYNSALLAAGDESDPAFQTMKAAREFGAELARQYKAVSPTFLIAALVEGLTNDGEVVPVNQLLQDDRITQWLKKIGASERQLRSAINAARKVRRAQASAASGVVVPPRQRKRASEQTSQDV